jgi:hypothetical protein
MKCALPSCSKNFTPYNSRHTYCSPEHRRQGYEIKQKFSRPFIALDGEGIGSNYVLLAAKRKGKENVHVYKQDGLSTETCLQFLLGLTKRSKTERPLYVWFAFDYDVNMILGDLPLKGETASIEELRATNSTVWNGYKITYIPRKIFKLSCNGRWFHSTDIFSFFQTSFENALQDWNIEVPEIITRGKAARQDFSLWSEADIVAYNDAELDCMSEIAERLRDSITPLKLPVRSWHGPGALAGSWLSKHKARAYKGEIPKPLNDAAVRAYFGGRIDVAGYGFVDPVYHYDIVSAYPSAIRYLPDFSSLTWSYAEGRRPPLAGISVSKIKWKIPKTKWGAFPWRNRQGSIRWPLTGEGWYWQGEIEAAIERFGPDCVEYLATWFTQGEIYYPFQAAIEEAFQYRRELKAQGLSSHIAVKLILNSLYGKFAQTVGKAQYYSPIWAGLITSYTRAELQRAISEEVVCVMTDSIWTRSPLSVDTSNELGAWEEQSEGKLILAGAGLYEAHKRDGSKIVWQRGFDRRRPLDIEGIVSHWVGDNPLYEGLYSINRFVGMGLASVTSYPWRHWIDLERKVQPVPFVGTTKRLPFYPIIDDREPGKDFHSLDLRPTDDGETSYPYSRLTLDPDNLVDKLLEECAE